MIQALEQQAAVWQSGHGVVGRFVTQARAGLEDFGEVVEGKYRTLAATSLADRRDRKL